jgi:pyridoxamine 5'-phosphate oxidase
MDRGNEQELRALVKSVRTAYEFTRMHESRLSKDPVKQFTAWMLLAIQSGVKEPNAMTLATIGKNGFPNARIVLLRDFDASGFSFFTNYKSNKGVELKAHKACLNFFWLEVARQVKITGLAERVPEEESDEYFASRPRESQLAAWASEQSKEISGRAYLEKRYKFYQKKFKGQNVPRPPHWGGYRVKPVKIEFWQGRENRLHDRIVYTKVKGEWVMKRIAP